MRYGQSLLLLLSLVYCKSVDGQLRLMPSFSIGKSAYYFFDQRPITAGQWRQRITYPTYKKGDRLFDYKIGLTYGSGKFGVYYSNSKYEKFEKLAVSAVKEGDLWFRRLEIVEFGASVSCNKARFFETSILSGFCVRKGEAIYFVGPSSIPDLSIDDVDYDSKGLFARFETKFRPCRWFFVAANLGLQFYPIKHQSYYLDIKRPRAHFIAGLSAGVEIPLKVNNPFQKKKVDSYPLK